MSLRAVVVVMLCLACANARGTPESDRETTQDEPMGNTGGAPRLEQPGVAELPAPDGCGLFALCASEFTVKLNASELWPLGRYFLRVAIDRRPPSVCEIAFEPVIGAVTDTCNYEALGFSVTYRYDDQIRAIEQIRFGYVSRVDAEILVAEALPPLVEVHHDVVVQKCSIACSIAEPIVVPVHFPGVADAGADAGSADAGEGALDAATDAAP
jgi:hypothetical protein